MTAEGDADEPLRGRVALVTGANHGIGAAAAEALARLGAAVAISYLRFDETHEAFGDPGRPSAYDEQRAQSGEAIAERIRARGGTALAVEADLADAAVPARLFDEVEVALGPIAILVNNASGWRKDSFRSTPDPLDRRTSAVTPASFEPQFLVDARASALLIAELAARHERHGDGWGRVISLTSGGPAGFPGEASYGAAKAALENYTMTASIELADLGITANVVYPPVTDTGWVTDAVRDFVEASTDHVHVAEPDEVAGVIAWLCTPAADLVTGSLVRLR